MEELVVYKGLLRLSLGILGFGTLLFVLRIIGERRQKDVKTNSDEGFWPGIIGLKIVEIVQETYDIKTFRLRREDGHLFPKFNEGQFITFQIGDSDQGVMRSYSLSSSTTNREVVSVSIKLLEGGIGSGWFHDRKVGDVVMAFPPNGQFTTAENHSEDNQYVFVAGGIGITPFMSMIKSNLDLVKKGTMNLFYGMKTTQDMAFHNELVALAAGNSNLNYIPVLSEQDDKWSGEKGFIGIDLIKRTVPDYKQCKYFFCGPPIMTEKISESLLNDGVEEEAIHTEKFASPASTDLSKVPAVKAKISTDLGEFDYDGKELLLDFLESNSVPMDSACRVGVCGSCKCKLISGEIDAFSDAGLTKDEIKAGMFQSCVARPKGDIVIELV